jgi:hypothetical protein
LEFSCPDYFYRFFYFCVQVSLPSYIGAQIVQNSKSPYNIISVGRVTWIKFSTQYLPILGANLQSLVSTAKWRLEFVLFCCTITVSLSNINFVHAKSFYLDIISSHSTLQLSNSTFAFLHSYNRFCYFTTNSNVLLRLIANHHDFRRIA